MKESDLNWLAGLLEGEGSFLKSPPSGQNKPAVSLQMTDEEIVARAATLLECNYLRIDNSSKRDSGRNWQDSFLITIRGKRAVELMEIIYPLMGSRRKRQIESAIATWIPVKLTKKVTREQGKIIELSLKLGVPAIQLAREYGISKWSVYAIGQGRYFSKK